MPVNGVRRDEPLGVHATEALPLLIEWAAGTGTNFHGKSPDPFAVTVQAEGAPPANAQANRKQ